MADMTTFGSDTFDEHIIVTAGGAIVPTDIDALCHDRIDDLDAGKRVECTNVGSLVITVPAEWYGREATNKNRVLPSGVMRLYSSSEPYSREEEDCWASFSTPVANSWFIYSRVLRPSGAIGEAPSANDRLYGTLQSYTSLAKGWDGYDGEPATAEAVQDAMAFLARKPDDIPLPYPEIAADGEVGLYWQSGSTFAEICFHGNGTFSYYAKHLPPDGELREFWGDDCSIDANWPEDLLLTLGKLER